MRDVGYELGLRLRGGLDLLGCRLLLGVEPAQLVDHVHCRVGQRRPGQQEAADHREQHYPGGHRGPVHPVKRLIGEPLAQPVKLFGGVLHLAYPVQPRVAGLGEGFPSVLLVFLVVAYRRPEVLVVHGRHRADLVRLWGCGVADADGLELVYLLVEPAVRAFEVVDAAARDAGEGDVAVVVPQVEDGRSQVVALVLQLDVVAGIAGGVLDALIDQDPDQAGNQDRHKQPADSRDGDPPGLLADTLEPSHAASLPGEPALPAKTR